MIQKIVILVCVLLAIHTSNAQCGKPVRIESLTVSNIKDGEEAETHAVEAYIDITEEEIVITVKMDGETEVVKNIIKEITYCEWKKIMIDGKAEYKVTSRFDDRPDTLESIIRVEGINGEIKVTCTQENDTAHGLLFKAVKYEEI